MAAPSAPASPTVGDSLLDPNPGLSSQAERHPHDPDPESPPLPPLPSESASHTLRPAVGHLKRESLISLGEGYDHDHEFGLHDGGSATSRDRRRVERWLEQQCRFASFDQVGDDAGGDEKGRVDVNVDEEAILPELQDEKSPTLISREGGGSRAGISTGAEEALPALPLPPLLSSSAVGAPPLSQRGGGERGADRADSPLLGYAHAPDNSEVGATGGGGGRQEGSAEVQGRGQDPNPTTDTDPGPDSDPLRFSGRNFSFVRELPLASDSPGFVSHPTSPSMAGEDATRTIMVRRVKSRDFLVPMPEKDKPLPPQPSLAEPDFSSTPTPTYPEEEHTHTGTSTATIASAAPSAVIGARLATTTASSNSTPESSFTVPSAVSDSAPSASASASDSLGLGTPPPPLLASGFGFGSGSGLGIPALVSASASGSATGVEFEDQERILDYPLSLDMTLSLSLPSPLSFPGLTGLTSPAYSHSPPYAPSSPAYTSSNSASTFTTQQQQQQQQVVEMKEGKKKHSPAPSYSSSHTASSSGHSHSYSHSVHSAHSYSHPHAAYSHSVHSAHSRAGSYSSSSRPLLSRSASSSSFTPRPERQRQRKTYLPLGPSTAASSANHSRTSSNFSISAASSSSVSAAGVPSPVPRPERKSSLANLRASIASTAGVAAAGTASPALSRRPSRTMHAVLSESLSEGEEKVKDEDEDAGVARPERKSSLINLRASTATIGASPSLSRRPSRTLASAVLSESSELELEDKVEAGQVGGAEESRPAKRNLNQVLEQRSAFHIGIQTRTRTQIALEAAASTSASASAPTASAPTPVPMLVPGPVRRTSSMGVSMGMGTGAGGGVGGGMGVGMYHLPTAMQLRASRSSSQLLLDAASVNPSVYGSSSSPASTSTLATPTPTSPLPPSAPPTRRQSRAAEVPYGGGHAANLSISSSVASPSRSRSRSRAGSITLNSFSNSTAGHAPSMSISSSIATDTASTASSSSRARHAVYIDSEEVRERLDELLARVGSDQSLEFERPWAYAASEDEDGGGGGRGEVYSGLLMKGGGEEEEDRSFTAAAGMTTTTTSTTVLSSGTGTTAGGNVMQMQGQERQASRDAHTHAQQTRVGHAARTPSALNLNLTMNMDIDTSATAHSPPPAPVNTPTTFFSLSTASTVPVTPVSASPSGGGGSKPLSSSTSTTTTPYNSPHVQATSSTGTGLLYENPHASSSQVYIGPTQLQQQGQASSSPSRSSGRSAGGVHSRDTSRSSNSNSNSNSHSSSGHSRVPSQAISLSLSRTQSRTQIHSRTSSQHSRAHSQSQSRSHSRAASKEKSVMSMSSMSPKQMIAQLPPTPLSAPAATPSVVTGGEQSPLPPMSMSMSMSIPVPLRLPPLPSASRKPSRPAPAPPLDLGGVDVDVRVGAPAGEVMIGDEHEERMREMMLAVGPDADEQLGVDPVVSIAGGGFVDVAAEVDVLEERMVFARGHDDDEGGEAYRCESDDGFEVVREMRRRTRVSVRVPAVPVEEVRRVEGEENGSEGEEMTVEDIERMQFLRGLKLEDRMEMPDMPADLDNMLVEFPRAPGSLPPTPERVLPQSATGSQPEVHFAEDDVLAATPPRGGLDVPADPSMSRWSLTSSTMDENLSGVDGKEKKEKERKRKSFVSFGAGKEKDKDKESGNLSPGWSEGEKEFGKDKEKKRGRLASFISRLSSVGGGPAPLAISSSSSGSMISSSEDVPPPVPSVPALSLLLPSPQILDGGRKKEKEKEALPPLPADATEPATGQAKAYGHASPRSTPPALKLDLSKTQSQTTQKYVVEKDDMEVASSVKGVWGSSAASTSTTTTTVPAPAKASKSVPGSAVDIAYARAALGMPTFSFARSAPRPKPKKPAPLRTQPAQQPLGKASSDGSIGSKPSTSTSASRSIKEAEQSPELARERFNSTTGSNDPLAKRPALVKSASASLLRQVPVPPKISRAGSAAPGGPAAMHLQTYPPQPESQLRRAKYQNLHQHQLQYQYRAPQVAGVDGSVPLTPSSLASTDVDEEQEDEEETNPEMARTRREKAHEERWARIRIEADTQEAASEVARQHQIQPHTDFSLLQRPRLKSMSSLGNLHAASASAVALSNFPAGQQSQLSPKSGKGFRGFVERMGLVGTSASNTPVSSYPGTPLNGSSPGPLSVSTPGSASASTAAFPLSPTPEVVEATPTSSWSPSHSPTTSLSGGNSISGGPHGPGLGSVSLLGMRGAKGPKRKLVINGVGLEDVKGYEAVKSWCESFGEVREMTRAPNGSLYVDFKKASVAETVCRLQAQVYIKGAGSVSLSWYTKKKPT